jgi:hypothetical protein
LNDTNDADRSVLVKWFNEARALDTLRRMVAARTSSLIFLIQVHGFKTLREKQRGAFELRQGSHSKQTANITLQ